MKDSKGRRIRRAALGLLLLLLPPRDGIGTQHRRPALAVDAADPHPAGGDLLRYAPDGGPLGDVGGGGGEQLELGPHEAHQGGEVLLVGRGVEGDGPAVRAGGGDDDGRRWRHGRRRIGQRRRRRRWHCQLVTGLIVFRCSSFNKLMQKVGPVARRCS